MIYADSTPKLWLFLKPFAPSLWLLMFSTTVVVAWALWLMEAKLDKLRTRPKVGGTLLQPMRGCLVGNGSVAALTT